MISIFVYFQFSYCFFLIIIIYFRFCFCFCCFFFSSFGSLSLVNEDLHRRYGTRLQRELVIRHAVSLLCAVAL